MNYELAKQLRDAGWPVNQTNGATYVPTLEELIEACGDDFGSLYRLDDNSFCGETRRKDNLPNFREAGHTPELALANLWLALNKKP